MSKEIIDLKWNDFKDHISSSISNMRNYEHFTDVTLVSEDGQQVEAHTIMLSTSSPFLMNLLKLNKHLHPLIFLVGIQSNTLMSIINFIYQGEVSVCEENLLEFLRIGEMFQLKGLNNYTVKNAEINKISSINILSSKCKEEIMSPMVNESTDVIGRKLVTTKVDIEHLDNIISAMMERNENKSKIIGKHWKCKECGKEGMKANIIQHIEAKHIDDFSHPCYQCGKSYRLFIVLSRHTQI